MGKKEIWNKRYYDKGRDMRSKIMGREELKEEGLVMEEVRAGKRGKIGWEEKD